MVTTVLEVLGIVLIAVAFGLAFGVAAFVGAAGAGFVIIGVALEGSGRPSSVDANEPANRSSS